MSKKRKHLSHAETWDDSELIDSWNEALAEYRYYHSLHARGEKVERVLREAEAAEAAEEVVGSAGGDGEEVEGGEEWEDGDHDEGEYEGGDDDGAEVTAVGEQGGDEYDENTTGRTLHGDDQEMAQDGPTVPEMPPLGSLPQALLGHGQDEAMKNLMMSWYYAGYYTGFYEGQRQAGTAVSGATADKDTNGNAG